MSYKDENANLWFLALYFYLAPLVASLIWVFRTGYLLGDFISTPVDLEWGKLAVCAGLYMLPMVVVVGALKWGRRFDGTFSHIGFKNGLFYLIVAVGISTACFGAIPVGGARAPGLAGVAQLISSKFNPYLIFLLLASINTTKRRMILGALCVLVVAMSQKSLLGYFIIAMSFTIYWVDNRAMSLKRLVIIMLLLTIMMFGLQDLLVYVYKLRNDARGNGGEVASNLVFGYALGRINSFSSLYQILFSDCCGSPPSTFYAVSTILGRLTGFTHFSGLSPTQAYNDFILGSGVDYALFTSMTGALYISLYKDVFTFLINGFFLLAVLVFMYILTPIPQGKRKLPLFLCIIYLPYLSGDVWELSLIFQSLLALQLTIFVFKLIQPSTHQTTYKNRSVQEEIIKYGNHC